MAFLGTFAEFTRRVLASTKKGGLQASDSKKLQNLLTRTANRNTVLAKGILSALSDGGATPQDVNRLGDILHKAEERILADKKPFSDSEQTEITNIFGRAYLSARTARWFSNQMDELIAEEITDFISGTRGISATVPGKKSVRFSRAEEREVQEAEERPRQRRRSVL